MDHNRWRMAKTGSLLWLSFLLLITTVLPAGSADLAAGRLVRWRLTEARVVDAGRVVETSAGSLVEGYRIEASASAIGRAPVQQGTFRFSGSIFHPGREMAGQQPDNWYVEGTWQITDAAFDRKSRPMKHQGGEVKGVFSAELPFDPVTQQGGIEARVRWPLTLHGAHWAQGQGIFSGNELCEGQLDLTLLRWQKVK